MKAQLMKNDMSSISEASELMLSINKMLAEASKLNTAGKYSEAFTLAYKASDKIAVAYLLRATGQKHNEGWDTYDLFDATLREPARHPELLQQIREIAGDAYVLRETYEPALIDEITLKDALQMINCVAALIDLVEKAEWA
jgi:HEPN domain-containing protein